MKLYVAIGHFKSSENITCISYEQNTRKDFIRDCKSNEFVPYVVITENTMLDLFNSDSFGVWEKVKKMNSNFRIWDDVTDYILQCSDIIQTKMEATR